MDRLDRECAVFGRYLIGARPNEYVTAKYRAYHRQLGNAPADLCDRGLLVAARLHPAVTRLAAAYVRLVRPRSALRHKLILLLAVLESCAPSSDVIDRAPTPPGVRLWMNLAYVIVRAGLASAVSVVVFAPWHLFAAVAGRLASTQRSPTPKRVEPLFAEAAYP